MRQLVHLVHGYPNPTRNFQFEYKCFGRQKLVIGNVNTITWVQPVYLIRGHFNRYFQFEYNSFTLATAVVLKKIEDTDRAPCPCKGPFGCPWTDLDQLLMSSVVL